MVNSGLLELGSLLVALAIAAVIGSVSLAVVIRWARRKLLDRPNARSSHTIPTPRGGGVAIVLGTFAGVLAGTPALTGYRIATLIVLVVAVAMGAVGFIDDLRSLSARQRFEAQIASALLLIAFLLPAGAFGVSLFWTVPLNVIWVVGMINAFNFMDGIDGMAGLHAIVGAGAWFVVALLVGSPSLAMFSAVTVVASLVFLVRNWSPAAIFMGDVGSAFLGLLFAAFPLLAASTTGIAPLRFLVIGGFIMWAFVYDAGATVFLRWTRGERITEAHRSHFYERLVAAGVPHWKVAIAYGLFGLLGAVAAWELVANTRFVALFAIPVVAALLPLVVDDVERRANLKPLKDVD